MRLKHYEREALHRLMKTQKQYSASEGSSRVACWISHKKKLLKEKNCVVLQGELQRMLSSDIFCQG